jgi:hypothetical protein
MRVSCSLLPGSIGQTRLASFRYGYPTKSNNGQSSQDSLCLWCGSGLLDCFEMNPKAVKASILPTHGG